jgi:hypothetical protein
MRTKKIREKLPLAKNINTSGKKTVRRFKHRIRYLSSCIALDYLTIASNIELQSLLGLCTRNKGEKKIAKLKAASEC